MDLVDSDRIPQPQDVDAENGSPFLRRQRPVPVRRSRFSRNIELLGRGIVFGIVLLPVGYAGYHAATYALTSPRFTVNSAEAIVINGNHFVSREEILATLGVPLGMPAVSSANIFRVSLEEKKSQVESIPWVRSATLMRAYPNRLAIHVVERTPVALANTGGQARLVDGEGVLLEKPENAVFHFPVLMGLEGAVSEAGPTARRERLALYQEFMRQLEVETTQAGWLISEVDVADTDDLKVLLVQGHETIQVHFGNKDFLERFHNLLAMLPEVRKTNTKIDSVDLRFRSQIVVNPVTGAAKDSEHPSGRLLDADAQKE